MGGLIDLTGQTFGSLTVLKNLGYRGGHIHWECRKTQARNRRTTERKAV